MKVSLTIALMVVPVCAVRFAQRSGEIRVGSASPDILGWTVGEDVGWVGEGADILPEGVHGRITSLRKSDATATVEYQGAPFQKKIEELYKSNAVVQHGFSGGEYALFVGAPSNIGSIEARQLGIVQSFDETYVYWWDLRQQSSFRVAPSWLVGSYSTKRASGAWVALPITVGGNSTTSFSATWGTSKTFEQTKSEMWADQTTQTISHSVTAGAGFLDLVSAEVTTGIKLSFQRSYELATTSSEAWTTNTEHTFTKIFPAGTPVAVLWQWQFRIETQNGKILKTKTKQYALTPNLLVKPCCLPGHSTSGEDYQQCSSYETDICTTSTPAPSPAPSPRPPQVFAQQPGHCGGLSEVWSETGRQDNCLNFSQKTQQQCEQACNDNPACEAYERPHASVTNCCLLKAGSTGDATAGWQCFVRAVHSQETFEQGAAYLIENMNAPGKYLNVEGGRTDNGANVQLWDSALSTHNQWHIVQISTGIYAIENVKAAGKYVNLQGGQTHHGANILIWENRFSTHNQWRIVQIAEGIHTIESVTAVGKYLTVQENAQSNGANIHSWDNPTMLPTKWRITKVVKAPSLVVSGAAYAPWNGVYEDFGERNGRRAWRNMYNTACQVFYYADYWGWGLACGDHHRYFTSCGGTNPTLCAYKVRSEHASGPAPTVVFEAIKP